jgi:hypothetical protein
MKDVLSSWEAGSLSQLEGAEILGMSERTFRRHVDRWEADGEEGLVDRRLGRRSGRAVPDGAAEEVERLYRERYQGFTARHFHERLQRSHSGLMAKEDDPIISSVAIWSPQKKQPQNL